MVAPNHPLARQQTTSLQEVTAYPIALQNKMLAIKRYLDARHEWLFSETRKMMETNSLQLVKLLGNFVAFTSELDAAPERRANVVWSGPRQRVLIALAVS